ncbi:MAG TPA: CinA family protein [Acholeplasmataceae bacterium]|nr:CinA family protein [Acholeplasmataceae bacterium]HRX44640.1 CinA family protein [Acholeplasmataceae bacterium]
MSVISVYQKCLDKGLTIAFAESMTGGGACHEMVRIEGASQVVLGGMIVYQKSLKEAWLDIDPSIINAHGVVSEKVSQMMALSIKQKTNSSIGIGITGNAGPTTQDEHEGLVAYISIYQDEIYHDMKLIFEGLSRVEAIEQTIASLYLKLDDIL